MHEFTEFTFNVTKINSFKDGIISEDSFSCPNRYLSLGYLRLT